MKKDGVICCDICGYKFIEGTSLKVTEHVQVNSRLRGWVVKKKRKRVYICEKCGNVGAALIRNNIAIKTRDILDR